MSKSKSLFSGFFWGSMDNLIRQGIQFAVGIILARLLSPQEFGVLGILTIFLSLSELFIESGFAQALIRKQNITDKEYSTVFYFNLGLSIFFYLILFFSSSFFESYFQVKGLNVMLKVFMLKLIISSFYFVQVIKLTQTLNFKTFTKISFFSGIISGIIGVFMAYYGFGVWSLIWQSLIATCMTAVLIHFFIFWKPSFHFVWIEIKELYKVSSYLLATTLLTRISNEMNTFVIGKYFSAESLGYYTRANSLKNLPSQIFNTIISKISLPILSNKQNDEVELKRIYKKLLCNTFFISGFVMLLLIVVAEPLILILLGEKWEGAILLFKYLSIIGIFYPANALNNNLIIAKGKTNLTFHLSIIKFLTTIPILILGALTNINNLVIGFVIVSIIHTVIYGYFSGKIISYKLGTQFIDIVKNTWFLILISFFLYIINFQNLGNWSDLFLKSSLYVILTLLFCIILKVETYLELKKIGLKLLKSLK